MIKTKNTKNHNSWQNYLLQQEKIELRAKKEEGGGGGGGGKLG